MTKLDENKAKGNSKRENQTQKKIRKSFSGVGLQEIFSRETSSTQREKMTTLTLSAPTNIHCNHPLILKKISTLPVCNIIVILIYMPSQKKKKKEIFYKCFYLKSSFWSPTRYLKISFKR